MVFAGFIGLHYAKKKPNEKFPYGYYKAENLAAFFVSLFILYAALELIQEGYSKLFSLPEITMPVEALSISLFSTILSFFLARYMEKVGKEINSQALIANGKERFAHVFSGLVVFIVILLSFFKIPYVEGIATIIFSLIVLKAGISSAKDSIFSLMDVAPPEELNKKIKEIISSVKGVEELKELKLRRAGPFVFGEASIKVGKNIDVEKAHRIADEIEEKVKKEVEEVDSLTIHVEPHEKEEVKIAIPISLDKGLNSKVMEHFGRADNFIFLFVDRKNKKIKDFYVKRNPFKREAIRAGLAVSKFLKKERVDVVITKEIGEISFHTLRDNLIEIYKAEGESVKEIIDNFLEGKLRVLGKPTREEKEKISTRIRRMWGRWRGGRWGR